MSQRTLDPESTLGATGWWETIVGPLRDGVLPTDTPGEPSARRSPVVARIMRLLPRLVLVLAVGLLVLALGIFVFRAVYADKVYPAVVVGDVAVGGMTVDEAVAAVERRAAELEQGTVAFTYNGQTWTPSLQEIGASVDVAASVDEAWDLGREENAVSRMGVTGQLLQHDQVVPLRTTVDRGRLDAWFESVNADIDRRAVDASLVVDGASVSISPEATGMVVDEEAATAMILGALQRLEPVASTLPTRVEQPAVYAADLESARASLEASLAQPLIIRFEDRKWDLNPAELTPFLTIDVAPGEGDARVALAMDETALAAWLRDRFSAEVNRAPVDAKVAWSAQENGLVVLEPSKNGTALRAGAFATAIEESFVNGGGAVEVPVVITKPEIDQNNLAALNINSRLARGDSNYGGQAWQRDTNVEVATKLINGELVAPGEEFSFNKAVGLITKDNGFVESGVIINGRASTGDGGGVCQVSTTVFRAAVLAGLPVTVWAEHTQRLPIYERDGWTAGYDASILQLHDRPESEWGDFKFRNDTGGYLLVQSWTDYPYVIVEIYGNDDGRDVQVSDATVWPGTDYPADLEVVDPELPAGSMQQTEWPRLPAEASFTMTVTYADGSVNEQQFYSVYHGNGNVWTVSPDMQGRSPAA